MEGVEGVGDLLLGDLHHPHPMLIFQIRLRIGNLTTNCSGHNHLKILVHTASIPARVFFYISLIFSPFPTCDSGHRISF